MAERKQRRRAQGYSTLKRKQGQPNKLLGGRKKNGPMKGYK